MPFARFIEIAESAHALVRNLHFCFSWRNFSWMCERARCREQLVQHVRTCCMTGLLENRPRAENNSTKSLLSPASSSRTRKSSRNSGFMTFKMFGTDV